MKLRNLNISPTTALRELEGFYKIYARDSKKNFTFTKTVALTKLQENILKAVDKRLLSAV